LRPPVREARAVDRLKVAVVSTALGPRNVFMTPPLFYGGLEEVAALRARYLLEQGHRVYLFAVQGSEGGLEGQVARLGDLVGVSLEEESE